MQRCGFIWTPFRFDMNYYVFYQKLNANEQRQVDACSFTVIEMKEQKEYMFLDL